ncbi:MAG TPA: DUF3017 domain-containing protein [Streptosporangiaceae bacterium]|nr:DUF3017 domain-containing protein [Streptosporangiaceae bacterium]
MANRPANAGSDTAGPDRAYDREPAGAGAPPPVHPQGPPRNLRTAPRPRNLRTAPRPGDAPDQATADVHVRSWLPYLIVLAGAASGLFIAWQGSQYAGLGSGLVGGVLLAAAAARLLLPLRYTGLLSSRRKAPDVTTLAVFGAAVLAIALLLP